MNEIRLSNDADALICVLYKEYLHRRKSGISKRNAKSFGGSDFIQENFMQKWMLEDVTEICFELSDCGFLSCLKGENRVLESELTDNAIIYMENRFKDGISAFFSHLEHLRTILP